MLHASPLLWISLSRNSWPWTVFGRDLITLYPSYLIGSDKTELTAKIIAKIIIFKMHTLALPTLLICRTRVLGKSDVTQRYSMSPIWIFYCWCIECYADSKHQDGHHSWETLVCLSRSRQAWPQPQHIDALLSQNSTVQILDKSVMKCVKCEFFIAWSIIKISS